MKYGLLPKEVTWSAWLWLTEEIINPPPLAIKSRLESTSQALSNASLTSIPYGASINKRFVYGELRLGRLDWVYRLALGKPREYLSGCTTYGAFVRDNVNSLITLFAYTTIILSAMQVGLATPYLANDYSFGMASYVFSIFFDLGPAGRYRRYLKHYHDDVLPEFDQNAELSQEATTGRCWSVRN